MSDDKPLALVLADELSRCGYDARMAKAIDQAAAELRRLAAVEASAQPAEPVADLLEVVDSMLAESPCDCPEWMKHDRGEHLSGCHLVDLNLARVAMLNAPPAAAQVPLTKPEMEAEYLRIQKQIGEEPRLATFDAFINGVRFAERRNGIEAAGQEDTAAGRPPASTT